MASRSDKEIGVNYYIYLCVSVLSVTISFLVVGVSSDSSERYSVFDPYVPVTGSYANHHPIPFVNHHHTSYPQPFVSSNALIRHPQPLVSSNVLIRHPQSVRTPANTNVLEHLVPFWRPNPDVSAISVGGVNVIVDTNIKGRPSAETRQCCPTCGARYDRFRPGYQANIWDYFPSPRVPVSIWPHSTSQYTGINVFVEERGSFNTLNYEIYFRNEGGPISPFHDIPLFANEGNKIFNMVVEVPRWTNAKMEISTKDPLNPIKQDVKKGKLRYVANVFPHHGYIWNYGALPQTWEDPNHMDDATGCKGDNDPIDVCEIGYRVAKRGDVVQVKILGTLALIDEGETDWKLIAIDVNDPMAPQLSDISDVEKHMPGFLKATVEWFKIYKIPDGKPENQFAFDGVAKDREFAHKVVMDTHKAWQELVQGKSEAGEIDNTCSLIPNAANKLSPAEAEAVVSGAAESAPSAPLDPKVDLWHYVSLK